MFKIGMFNKISLFASIGSFIFVFHYFISSQNFYRQPLRNFQSIQKNVYLVNTSNCKIINWPVFDEQVLPLYEDKSGLKIDCEYQPKYDIRVKRYNFTGIKIENNSYLKCYSSCIRRPNSDDNNIIYTKPVKVKNTIEYFPEEIAVQIICKTNKGKTKFKKVVPLIPEKNLNITSNKNSPNILLIGLDSTSRINFERHFPKTRKFIEKYKFYTMYGYNKVADNTFVNLTPLLTGHYVEDIWNENVTKTFDYFPFIWNEYEVKGYNTLLFEDAPNMATFNYLRKGFSKPPTTYYLRPYNLAVGKHFLMNTYNYCYLDKPEVEIYYEYLYDFVKAMVFRNQSYFAFHFMAQLTHDDLNKAGYLDPIYDKLFNRLFDENLLSNTIIIFFSDHGLRFGPIRKTLSGKIEERLPFMHLYLPNEWRNYNLTINENRLTTPFDIHSTLMHIIRGKPNYNLRYGNTLFEEIPENRSCNSISIPEHWCSCQSSEPIHDLTIINPISEFIVKSVNNLLSKRYSDKCVRLELNNTLSAFEQQLNDKVLNFDKPIDDILDGNLVHNNKTNYKYIKHYLLTINVKPSDAVFESTVKLNKTSGQMSLLGEVSRINLYANQSICINDPVLRKYCFCKT